jgi:hypothetical protein
MTTIRNVVLTITNHNFSGEIDHEGCYGFCGLWLAGVRHYAGTQLRVVGLGNVQGTAAVVGLRVVTIEAAYVPIEDGVTVGEGAIVAQLEGFFRACGLKYEVRVVESSVEEPCSEGCGQRAYKHDGFDRCPSDPYFGKGWGAECEKEVLK